MYIVMGDDFVLNCSYRANPAITAQVIWYKNGNILDFQNTQQRNLTSDGAVIKILTGFPPGNCSLIILPCFSATRVSNGLYSCRVENDIGSSEISDIASVYVEDVPEVVLDIDPVNPVSEPKKENVTLSCTPLPPDESLIRVKWFLDGELLKELPECSFK